MVELLEENVEQTIHEALTTESVPRIYFNGFVTALGAADVMLILKQQDQPVGVLNMSYTVGKTLSRRLGTAIAALEEMTGNVILTNDEIMRRLRDPREPR